MLLITLLGVTTSGCGRITVRDHEVCGDLGGSGAHCIHTLTENPRDITKPKWDIERVGMLCMDSQAFTDVETAIDQFCTAYNVCDYESRVKVEGALFKVRLLKRRLDATKGRK